MQKNVASMRALPRGLWAFLGAFGCVAGLGAPYCPARLRTARPDPIAAAAVAVESVVISAFYLYYRDSSPMVYGVAMAIVAAFIAYGRFALRPL